MSAVKDYRAIKLRNGIRNAVTEALADIVVARVQGKVKAYKSGMITADEFLDAIRTSVE